MFQVLTLACGSLVAGVLALLAQDEPKARAARPPVEIPEPGQRQRARLEPEGNRILHFIGGTIGQYDVIEHYEVALGKDVAPVGDSIWIDLPGTRDFSKILAGVEKKLASLKAQGRMCNLSVGFMRDVVDGVGDASDVDFAMTSSLDQMGVDLGRMLAASGVPILLRIGGEMNGWWTGTHPYVFPLAFRKLVKLIREQGCRNVAVVWCISPAGDTRIFEYADDGSPRWYPGDEYVDWLGLDVYRIQDFTATQIRGRGGRNGGRSDPAFAVTQALLAKAREVGKPVFVGESSCYQQSIPNPADDSRGLVANKVWEAWFAPYIAWLDAHPEIKAITMCPVDWTMTSTYADWGDSRIHRSPTLTKLWRAELEKARWIHLPELLADGTYR